MGSKKSIAKDIKRSILNNDCDFDYIYLLLKDNTEEVLSGVLNSLLYLFRNIDNSFNRDNIDNLMELLFDFTKKIKNRKILELIYNKIDIFLSNISKSFDWNDLLVLEEYIVKLINVQNLCIMNNMRRAKGDKYNFMLYLIFEKRDIELLERYIENNMKELLINNSIISSVLVSVIERYIEIEEDNEIEIKYYNRVLNLFLRGRMYDKIINGNNDFLKVLKSSKKEFVWKFINKFLYNEPLSKEEVASDYDVSFIVPRGEEYKYFPNGKIDLTQEDVITIDNRGDMCLDDGLSIRDNLDGTYTLYIHLANPSAVIPYGSQVMREALKKCNTLYLIDDSNPIFDRCLSDGVLSLLPNKYTNALTIIVDVDIDYSLNLDTLKIVPSIIQNKNRLTYEEVDDMIVNGGGVSKQLLLLSKIFDKQALDNPKISAYHRLENVIRGRSDTNSSKSMTSISHMIVEQSNVFANSSIYIIDKRDGLNLVMPWRVQENITDADVDLYLEEGGFDTDNKQFRMLLKNYLIRGRYSNVNLGHVGLGIDGYVRISSAARRSMDALAIYALYDLYIDRTLEDMDLKYYYWEKEIKYWCEYANNRTSENNNFVSQYNYLYSRGKILDRKMEGDKL